MKARFLKYLIYIIALPIVGFYSMYALKPATEGAHDGGFLGMVFGLIVGQTVFTLWAINFRWYFSICIGIGLAVLTITLSFWVIGTLRDTYNPIKEGSFFRERNENLESTLMWVFFSVLLSSSILIFEILSRIKERTQEII